MKKFVFTFVFVPVLSWAASAEPEVEVQLSPGTLPTQRIYPGDEGVEVLRLWFTARNHGDSEGILLKKLQVQHSGSDRDQILRYLLMQGNKILEKESLVDSDLITFSNLSLWLADEKTIELRILADVSTGDVAGHHKISLPRPGFVVLKENDIRDPETHIWGDFPIEANNILIAENFDAPSEECNLREEPVCGEDGKTYYNLCFPFQKGIEILYEGPCYQKNFAPEEPCPENFEPICGEDGKTYTNQCFLDLKEDISKKHKGSCFPENFNRPNNFLRAVELFDLKKNELEQLRPRISDQGQARLDRISFVLHQYNFTLPERRKLVPHIADFLDFSQNLSDRTRLEQEIELLNARVIDARTESAEEKYKIGKIPFRDVDEDAWFLGPVLFLKEKGWATGYINTEGKETGLFRPGQLVTRAEITDLVFDSAGIQKSALLPPQNPLAVGHWAQDVIGVAEEMGLSLWEDLPNPGKKVDRVDVLKLIFEVFNIEIPTKPLYPHFLDVNFDYPEFNMIQYAKQLGLVSGYPDKTFRPEESIVRAEAAKIIKNAYDIFRKK